MWKLFKKSRYAQGVKEASVSVITAFQRRRRQLIRMSLLSVGLTLLSLAVVGTQLFYPFHVIIGVCIYLVSFVPFGYRLYLSRDTWREYHSYKLTTNFVKKERGRLFLAMLGLFLVAVFLWLRPLFDAQPFAGLTNEGIVDLVNDDFYRSVTTMDYLETTGNELLVVLNSNEHDNNQTSDIETAFTNFLRAVAYSESLTDTHRHFSGIPYREWDTRLRSFLISYSLYVKKYELVHRIIMAVDSEHEKTALNQFIPMVDRGNIYTEMVSQFYHFKTRVRLTGGYLYQRLFISDGSVSDTAFILLRDKSQRSYQYLASNFGATLKKAPEAFIDVTEEKMFTAWFPIQKSVATAMGRAILSSRGKEGLITIEQARVMGIYMEPGDIMLQRRNWHISNVGIPGFWTHSALYTGSLADMDEYFASEFPYEGYESMSAYLKSEAPAAMAILSEVDSAGDVPAVIEAIEPGVVIQTLPVSADADFVVVLRPRLTKQDKFLALVKAFSNLGKPYDFNFDFATRDALVCSELVYDAYYERLPEKSGIQVETSIVNGRTIVSPFDMAKKYVAERGHHDQQFDFVYFLRGNEEIGTADVSDESTFVESVGWSKFSFFQE